MPVDAQQTLFRVGSITKLTVATAVMQLVEDGQVDLDEPVADLIDMDLATRFDEPITLRHLLSHTAGFEERLGGLFMDPGRDIPPLGEALTDPPEQIFASGTTPAYSNYGNALAGYVVERVTGMDFDEYAATRIFEPLGMDTATLAQPLPEELAGQMATGYHYRGSEPVPFEHVGIPPAGSMSAAAPDMSAFMLAHLGVDAEADDGEAAPAFLSPESVHAMQQPAFGEQTLGGLAAAGPRTALGWYEVDRNGHRIVGYGGDTIAFHAELQIYPEQGTGIYVALNSAGVRPQSTGVIREQVMHGFADRYFPTAGEGAAGAGAQGSGSSGEDASGSGSAAEQATDTAVEHAQVLAGTYMPTRTVESNFTRLYFALSPITVRATDEGIISSAALTDAAGLPLHLVETEPWVWQEVGGQYRIAADVADGQVRAVGVAPMLALEPMPASLAALPLVLVGALAVLVIALVGWPVAALVRRRYGMRLEMSPRRRRWRRASMLAAGLALAAVAAWGMVAVPMMGLGEVPAWSIRVAQVLTLLGALGVVPAAGRAVTSARERRWWALAGDVLLTAAFAGFAYVAIVGRLLGWDITY